MFVFYLVILFKHSCFAFFCRINTSSFNMGVQKTQYCSSKKVFFLLLGVQISHSKLLYFTIDCSRCTKNAIIFYEHWRLPPVRICFPNNIAEFVHLIFVNYGCTKNAMLFFLRTYPKQ